MDDGANPLRWSSRAAGNARSALEPSASSYSVAAKQVRGIGAPAPPPSVESDTSEIDISPYWAMMQQGLGCSLADDTTALCSREGTAKREIVADGCFSGITWPRPFTVHVPRSMCQEVPPSDSSDGVSDSEYVAACRRVEAASRASVVRVTASHVVDSGCGDVSQAITGPCPLTRILGRCPGRVCPRSSVRKKSPKRRLATESVYESQPEHLKQRRVDIPPHLTDVAQTRLDTPSPVSPVSFSAFENTW